MRGIKANFIFNVLGTLAPLAVSFVTIPLFLTTIGAGRYGILSIVWLLVGYFGFLDFGLSRASTHALSKLNRSSSDERSPILMTGLWLNLGLGLFGSLILYVVGGFLLEHVVDVTETLKPEITSVFPWIAASLPLAMISGFAIGVLESRDQFLIANVLQFVGTTLGQVLPLLFAVFISPSLSIVIPATVLSRGLSLILILGFVLYDEGLPRIRCFDRKRAWQLLGYGGWASVSAIFNPLLNSLDQFMVGSVLGVAAAAHYAVPMNLVLRTQIVVVALSRTLFPQWARAVPEKANALAERALVTLAYGYAAICAPAIVLINPFLMWWMGRDFAAIAGPIGELLFIGVWINGLAWVPAVLLLGQGRPDVLAKFHAIEIIPFIIILWFMTARFGLIGAASAWVLRVSVDAAFMFSAERFWVARPFVALAPLGFILTGYLFVRLVTSTLLVDLSVATILAVGILITGGIVDEESRVLWDRVRFRGERLWHHSSISARENE
ncbi:MAG TPA: oligosaccharide flippase family protein [Methylocella sp.]|nr:oligosaccharide flippase family protein [Methylocella sp.]